MNLPIELENLKKKQQKKKTVLIFDVHSLYKLNILFSFSVVGKLFKQKCEFTFVIIQLGFVYLFFDLERQNSLNYVFPVDTISIHN